jgi:hypothetical protein
VPNPAVKGKVSTAIYNTIENLRIGDSLEVTSQYQRKITSQFVRARGLRVKMEKLPGKEHFRIWLKEKKKARQTLPGENPGFPELTKWTEQVSVPPATSDQQRAADEPFLHIETIPQTMPVNQPQPALYAMQKKWQWNDPNPDANKIGGVDRRTIKERKVDAITICEVHRQFFSGTPMVQIASRFNLSVKTVHDLLMGRYSHFPHYKAAEKLMKDQGLTDTFHTLGIRHR